MNKHIRRDIEGLGFSTPRSACLKRGRAHKLTNNRKLFGSLNFRNRGPFEGRPHDF